MGVQICLGPCFLFFQVYSFRYIPRSGHAGSYNNSMFNFFRESSCHFPQPAGQHMLFSSFLFLCFDFIAVTLRAVKIKHFLNQEHKYQLQLFNDRVSLLSSYFYSQKEEEMDKHALQTSESWERGITHTACADTGYIHTRLPENSLKIVWPKLSWFLFSLLIYFSLPYYAHFLDFT